VSSRPFTEIRAVKQTPGEPRLRWFQSDYFDLFVWYEEDDRFWGFRLCYDRGFEECALTWRRQTGRTTHHSVDDSRGLGYGGTPMLREAGQVVPSTVGRRFHQAAETLPEEIRTLIDTALSECFGERWSGTTVAAGESGSYK